MKKTVVSIQFVLFILSLHCAFCVDITDFVFSFDSPVSRLSFGVRGPGKPVEPNSSRDNLFFTSVEWEKPYLICATMYDGIYIADMKGKESYFLSTMQGLKYNSVRKVVLSGKTVAGFYANNSGGLFLFDIEKFKLTHIDSVDRLDSSNILDCEFVGDKLFLITNLGTLYRIDIVTMEVKAVKRISVDEKSTLKLISFQDRKLMLFRAANTSAVLYELNDGELEVKKMFAFEKPYLTWKDTEAEGSLILWSCSEDFIGNDIIQIDSRGEIFQMHPSAQDKDRLFAVSAMTKWYKRFVFTPFLGLPHLADALFTNIELIPLKSKVLIDSLENNLCSFIRVLYGRIIFFTVKGAVGLPKDKVFEVIEQQKQEEELAKDKELLQKLASEQVTEAESKKNSAQKAPQKK